MTDTNDESGAIGQLIASGLAFEQAERIGDRVGRYQATIRAVHACAAILRALPIEELSEDGRRADAVGWFVDPTLYREKAAALRTDLDVLRAASRFVKEIATALERARTEAER